MEPDEPATVRANARPARGRTAADLSLGAGAADVMRRVSVNIGIMQGGVKINMLPAECVLEVDFRLPVGISRAAVLRGSPRSSRAIPAISFEELLPGGIPKRTVPIRRTRWSGHLTRNAGVRLGLRAAADRQPRRHRHALLANEGRAGLVYGCSPAGMGGIDESRQHRRVPSCDARACAGGVGLPQSALMSLSLMILEPALLLGLLEGGEPSGEVLARISMSICSPNLCGHVGRAHRLGELGVHALDDRLRRAGGRVDAPPRIGRIGL